MHTATAVAHSNIALAKYWGKASTDENLPAVPSLSMTLNGLFTRTQVVFNPTLVIDEVQLDGQPAPEAFTRRVVQLLDHARLVADSPLFARVVTVNNFPTAAGLASSASGFAALALAATRALGLQLGDAEVSALARACSASAARSVFGGYVALDARARTAYQLAPAEHFPLAMIVAVVAASAKSMSSTQGMLHTQATSPYYQAWLDHAPGLYQRISQALLARDLTTLGPLVEQSALMMHASMWAAQPPLNYLLPATLQVMHQVRQLQARGLPAYITMDAGPNVKVLTAPEHAPEVAAVLERTAGVERVIACGVGSAAHLVED